MARSSVPKPRVARAKKPKPAAQTNAIDWDLAIADNALSNGFDVINYWLKANGRTAFSFQEETWQLHAEGQSGMVNAPTGFGKTFAVFLAVIIDWINQHASAEGGLRSGAYRGRANGLQLLWITPLRALAKDISRAMEAALEELNIKWEVGVRNGDTPVADRAKQKKNTPEILIITPESLQLLIGTKGHPALFEHLSCIAVDEWHELLGTKRGVQVELALSRIKAIKNHNERTQNAAAAQSELRLLRVWGISATIGNLPEAMAVLIGEGGTMVRATQQKLIEVHTILPESVEVFPYAGHLGLKMIDRVLPVIHASRTTLLFTNVRSQAEMWYQALLAAAPELAGLIALHHSAIDGELRGWVEDQLHTGSLKVVVCTSSLDLGVDFRPVDTVIQIGSPKGVARFLQRAGRSGHQPDAVSNICFVPTHSLEILESKALQSAYQQGIIEQRVPVVMAYDVLVQYAVTCAAGDGFVASELYDEVITTHCYTDLTPDEWSWILQFITTGGATLKGYDEYHKVSFDGELYRITDRRIAMRHRMHMGTIVSDALLRVKFLSGGFIGTIEEYFISRLSPGDAFILAGKRLELIMVKDMDALVRSSTAKNATVPAWNGGRLPLSANLGRVLRQTYEDAQAGIADPLYEFMQPLLQKQARVSAIPSAGEVLLEMIDARDGYHLFVYPFEGRLVHQAMAALLAYRIGNMKAISFSIAMNDYGFELMSDQPIPVNEENVYALFTTANWYTDLQRSLNAAELARRKFRDIAVIAGLIFQGMPGEKKKQRHLQNSASLIYEVLTEQEPNHLLLQQAFNEVLTMEVEAERLYHSLERISASRIIITHPKGLTPFCFPIKVDSLREQLSSEKLEDRIAKMREQINKL